jgi:hypothetical protein
MLATGAALLVAAEFAGATPDRRGRILRYQSAYQDWSIPNLALK